jgi:hypothetical protein
MFSFCAPTTLHAASWRRPCSTTSPKARVAHISKPTQPAAETLSIIATNRSGSHIIGDAFSYVTVDKNYVIADRPWPAFTPVFWQLAEGSVRVTPTRLLMLVNSDGKFNIGTRCVPKFPSGKSWSLSLISNVDCTIRFTFSPNPFQEFNLSAGVSKTVVVTIPTGPLINDININVFAASNLCQVSMSDWTPTSNTVDTIQYTLVTQVSGEATYQSTGLLLKPYFLSLDLLQASYDGTDTADGGKIYF